jgi:HlyD family secretion protein
MIFDKFSKIKSWAISHKKTSIVLILILAFLGYKIYQNFTNTSGQPKYIISFVKKGSIITAVTGSGQVSANNQIDVQSKASGDIVGVYVKPGQTVSSGTLLAQVDTKDASLTLQSAELAYQKLVEPAKPQDIKAAKVNVNTAYNDGWNSVSSTFIDYPSIITGMDNMFYKSGGYLNNINVIQRNDAYRSYIEKAGINYDQAKAQYAVVLAEYNSLSRSSATSSIDLLINDTQKMIKMMADALKNTQSAVSFISQTESDTSIAATTAGSNVNSWTATLNSHLSSVLSAQSSITNTQNTLDNLERGADKLDVEAQQVSLQKQQLAYQNYFIRAPFDGIIARVPVSIGSPGSGATIATMVTNQKIANISLNEVDVAKIKVGDKVNLTFDAIDGLNITGEVAEIDLVGTASQGVVNYNIKIGFDTQDDRVKSGMSVNASIITNNKQDVLVVPSSSIKSQGNTYYVDYFDQKYPEATASAGVTSTITPLSKQVEIGLSDDTNTEIVSGLNEGDQIIGRTVTQTTTTSATPSIFGAASNRNSSTNAVRRIGG